MKTPREDRPDQQERALLASAVRVRRKLRGLTAEAAAKRIGETQSRWSKWETTENAISALQLCRICAALDTTPDALTESVRTRMKLEMERRR